MRKEIREKAYKRYILGYPPRKPNDTSIGDSINWEWIIYCATQCHDDIVLISRDSDYRAFNKNNCYLNDWLHQEFKERVSHKRSITLTGLLSEGFKTAGITVPLEEEQAEETFLQYLQRESSNKFLLRTDIHNRLKDLIADATSSLDTLAIAFPQLITPNSADDEPFQPEQSDKDSDKEST